jgi:hypothetical protein
MVEARSNIRQAARMSVISCKKRLDVLFLKGNTRNLSTALHSTSTVWECAAEDG